MRYDSRRSRKKNHIRRIFNMKKKVVSIMMTAALAVAVGGFF